MVNRKKYRIFEHSEEVMMDILNQINIQLASKAMLTEMTILVKTKMKKDMNKLARIFIPEEDQVHRKMAQSIIISLIMMIHEVAIMIDHISGNSNRRMMRYTIE